MSKAILVVDVPDYFNSIMHGVLKPIGTVGKLEIGYGNDDGEMICYKFINVDGLPLKPMPEKQIIDIETTKDNVHYYAIGFNDCIGAILGEEE